MSEFWKKSLFWQNMAKTCALFGGPVTAGLHQFEADSCWVWASGVIAMLGALIGIWTADNNNNGIVDLFE